MENLLTYFPHLLLTLTFFSGVMWSLEKYHFAPKRAVVDRERADQKPERPWWIEYSAGLFPILFTVFFVRSFLVEPFRIPSSSMRPGLEPGDLILVQKFAYGVRVPILNTRLFGQDTPQRGDVLVFKYPKNPKLDYIKRVIGTAGDTVQYRNKLLTINGEELAYQKMLTYQYTEESGGATAAVSLTQFSETLNKNTHRIAVYDLFPPLIAAPQDFPFRENCQYDDAGFVCKVPAGHYFVMGDNRDNSEDGRYWGFVPDANVVGRAFFVWMNFSSPSRIGRIQ